MGARISPSQGPCWTRSPETPLRTVFSVGSPVTSPLCSPHPRDGPGGGRAKLRQSTLRWSPSGLPVSPGQLVRSAGTSVQGRRQDGEPREQGVRQLRRGGSCADACGDAHVAFAGGRRESGRPEGPSVPTGWHDAWAHQIPPSPKAHSAEVDLSPTWGHLLCPGLHGV